MIGMKEIKERDGGKLEEREKRSERGRRRRRVVPLLPQRRGICFVFQLMEDPEAALERNSWFVCGRDRRLLAGGRWTLQP